MTEEEFVIRKHRQLIRMDAVVKLLGGKLQILLV
jgi:hypothetical protein